MIRGGCALVAAALLAVGCGGDGSEPSGAGGTRPLVWVETPVLLEPEALPRDRVVQGEVRNESLRPLRIVADDIVVVDDAGRETDASAAFLGGFVRSLAPYNRPDEELTEAEEARLGRHVEINPGESAPLTVSWRREPAAPMPTEIDYGSGRLPLPSG